MVVMRLPFLGWSKIDTVGSLDSRENTTPHTIISSSKNLQNILNKSDDLKDPPYVKDFCLRLPNGKNEIILTRD